MVLTWWIVDSLCSDACRKQINLLIHKEMGPIKIDNNERVNHISCCSDVSRRTPVLRHWCTKDLQQVVEQTLI